MTATRFRIGPLTTYADPGELRAWLASAREGDRATYAIGPALGEGAEAKRIAAEAASCGEAHLFQKREGRGWRYLIVKGAAPTGIARQPQEANGFAPDSPEIAVLTYLRETISSAGACPTLEEIAEGAGLKDRFAARHRFDRLVAAGLVKVTAGKAFGRRTVEIME